MNQDSQAVDIVRSIAAEHGVSVDDLRGPSRACSFARQVAMWTLRTKLGWSYHRIAQYFCRSDHGTAMYACRVVEDRLRRPVVELITVDYDAPFFVNWLGWEVASVSYTA